MHLSYYYIITITKRHMNTMSNFSLFAFTLANVGNHTRMTCVLHKRLECTSHEATWWMTQKEVCIYE